MEYTNIGANHFSLTSQKLAFFEWKICMRLKWLRFLKFSKRQIESSTIQVLDLVMKTFGYTLTSVEESNGNTMMCNMHFTFKKCLS